MESFTLCLYVSGVDFVAGVSVLWLMSITWPHIHSWFVLTLMVDLRAAFPVWGILFVCDLERDNVVRILITPKWIAIRHLERLSTIWDWTIVASRKQGTIEIQGASRESFPRFGKITAIILLNMFSMSLACASFSMQKSFIKYFQTEFNSRLKISYIMCKLTSLHDWRIVQHIQIDKCNAAY